MLVASLILSFPPPPLQPIIPLVINLIVPLIPPLQRTAPVPDGHHHPREIQRTQQRPQPPGGSG